MEEKIISMLEQLYVEIKTVKEEQSNTNKRLDSLELAQSRTEEHLARIESKVGSIEEKHDYMEVQNANRHVELNGKIDSLSKDITVVEAVAGKNMLDIANIKLVK